MHLAEKLRQKYAELKSWRRVSTISGVLTPAGKPNPRLAQMIAGGYEPRKLETRIRLGLPPACSACGRKARHSPPAWLAEAVENLRRLEAAANPPLDPYRVYGRGGRRAKVAQTSRLVRKVQP